MKITEKLRRAKGQQGRRGKTKKWRLVEAKEKQL